MAEFFCQKVATGTSWALVPAHQSDVEAIKTLPRQQPVKVKVTRIRNVNHHRKYFALLNYAFDVWEPGNSIMESAVSMKVMSGELEIEKNFDRFRKDIAILAGFYIATYRTDNTVRIEAKSISFANMDQAEFEQLYDKTIDVIIKYVLRNYTVDELRAVVEQVMEFDS